MMMKSQSSSSGLGQHCGLEMVSKQSAMPTKINSPLGHFAAFGWNQGFAESLIKKSARSRRKANGLGAIEQSVSLVLD